MSAYCLDECMHETKREHISYGCWFAVMMYVIPIRQVSDLVTICMVIIAYRLTQGWVWSGGFIGMTSHVPPTGYFKLLWLGHLAPWLVNTQSWARDLNPDKVCTDTAQPPVPTSPHTPNHPCFFSHKLFRYHTSISQGDQYRCNSLGLQKSASLQTFARITAIDSRFGLVHTLFNVFATVREL